MGRTPRRKDSTVRRGLVRSPIHYRLIRQNHNPQAREVYSIPAPRHRQMLRLQRAGSNPSTLGMRMAGNTRFDGPPSITSLNPSPIHGEIEHEAANRIPSPELRPLSRQGYPPHEETITDAISPACGSVGSKPQTWDCSSYHPTVEYYQPDRPAESWNPPLVDSTLGPPFPHSRCINNTPTRAPQVFPSLGPAK